MVDSIDIHVSKCVYYHNPVIFWCFVLYSLILTDIVSSLLALDSGYYGIERYCLYLAHLQYCEFVGKELAWSVFVPLCACLPYSSLASLDICRWDLDFTRHRHKTTGSLPHELPTPYSQDLLAGPHVEHRCLLSADRSRSGAGSNRLSSHSLDM